MGTLLTGNTPAKCALLVDWSRSSEPHITVLTIVAIITASILLRAARSALISLDAHNVEWGLKALGRLLRGDRVNACG